MGVDDGPDATIVITHGFAHRLIARCVGCVAMAKDVTSLIVRDYPHHHRLITPASIHATALLRCVTLVAAVPHDPNS